MEKDQAPNSLSKLFNTIIKKVKPSNKGARNPPKIGWYLAPFSLKSSKFYLEEKYVNG